MTIAALHGTLLLYTMEKSSLSMRLMGIMDNINIATGNATEIMEQTSEKRAYYSNMAENDSDYADSTQYEVDIDAVQADYELQLAQINSWDSQLQQEKNNVETQLNVVTTYEQNWTTLLKNNIKKDFTYGSSGS